MRQKKILLVFALFLFVLFLTNAYADDFYFVQQNSLHNAYDPRYFSGADQYYMVTAAGTESNSSRVFVQFNDKSPLQYDPIAANYQLFYLPSWSALLPPNNINVRSFAPYLGYYGVNNAVFFIDMNNNSAYETGEPLRFIPSRASRGGYRFLNATSNVQFIGGIYPTITWDPVADAENYRVGIVAFNPDGTPNINNLQFIVTGLTSTSYTYSGSPLEYGQSYAFFIEARDYMNDESGTPIITTETLLNYSRYFTEYTPAVPEPATMLLLGSGLIGLAGYGRKKLFKK